MKIDARLTFDKIRHDQDFDAHLVLSLTAPALEAQTARPSICIIPVIDVSPSMAGEKIAYAKRSVEKLIDHLGPNDYCGLVQFSMTAEVIQKPVKITAESKSELRRKVAGLSLGNATNIADGLLVGLELGNKMDLPGNVVTRVILFTDGQANRGPATTTPELVKLLEANLGICSVSAFGYGQGADQDLLGELAKKGNANYAFVQNPDDALTAFGKELGGLLSTYGTNILLNVAPCADHEITDIVSDVDSEEEKVGGGVRIKIPDILCEENRNIVLGIKLKAQKGTGPRAVTVFDVKGGYDILDANSKKERKGFEAKAKVQFVKEGEEQKTPDAELSKIVGLAEVVRAQLEAEEKAKKGDYIGAVAHMNAMADSLGSRGHNMAQHLAKSVSHRLESAQAYNSGAGYLRSLGGGGTRGMGVASYDAQAQSDLQSFGVQLSNSSQTSTSNSFAGGVVVPAPVDQGLLVTTDAGFVQPIWASGMPVPNVGGPILAPAAPPPVVAVTPPPSKKEEKKSPKLSKKSQNRW